MVIADSSNYPSVFPAVTAVLLHHLGRVVRSRRSVRVAQEFTAGSRGARKDFFGFVAQQP